MTELLLIFLGAAYLDNLVLVRSFDRAMVGSKGSAGGILIIAGALLVLAAAVDGFGQAWLPPQARTYLYVLAFITTAITLVRNQAAGATWRGLRRHLPLLVANLAALAFAWLEPRHRLGWLETASLCLGASVALQVTRALFSSSRERLEAADLPSAWRGSPIALLTASLMSVAAMGFAGSLPW